MNIQEIIEQEERAFNAKKNVEVAVKKNKSEILLPLAMKIFEFFEAIQNDPKFLFTSQAHPRDEDWTPLFHATVCNLDSYKKSVTNEINKCAFTRMSTRNFSYGDGNSRWITFGVSDDFKPFVGFSKNISPEDKEKFNSTEEAIREMTKFFLKMRKPCDF